VLDENASPSSEEPNPYPVSPPSDPRRRRLIGSVIAVVAVAAGIGLLVAVNGHSTHKTRRPHSAAHGTPSTHRPSHTPSKKPSSAPPTHASAQPTTPGQSQNPPPPGAATHEPLTVLNNSLIHNLADDAAATFREHGWSVRLVGNVKGRFWQTTAYYAPGFEDQAKELQRAFPRITRVLPRYEGLPGGGNLTVVVTKYWLG
jgi:hypothetical protein